MGPANATIKEENLHAERKEKGAKWNEKTTNILNNTILKLGEVSGPSKPKCWTIQNVIKLVFLMHSLDNT